MRKKYEARTWASGDWPPAEAIIDPEQVQEMLSDIPREWHRALPERSWGMSKLMINVCCVHVLVNASRGQPGTLQHAVMEDQFLFTEWCLHGEDWSEYFLSTPTTSTSARMCRTLQDEAARREAEEVAEAIAAVARAEEREAVEAAEQLAAEIAAAESARMAEETAAAAAEAAAQAARKK